MRINLRLSILFAFFLVMIGMKAATVTGAKFEGMKITYNSVDANNESVTLSAFLYVPYKEEGIFTRTRKYYFDYVVLNSHPTVTNDAAVPTGSNPQLDAIKYMTSENALVICPDYIGFGSSKDRVHPYMCETLTARNVMDCYKAAMQKVADLKATVSANYYTLNVGYSQGGGTALAFQKYLETKATDAERAMVNLHGTVCGAGPYDLNVIFDVYEQKDAIAYPVSMYYLLRGHKEVFGKTTMRGLELKDCFTANFWEYCENTLKELLDKKEMTVDEVNSAILEAGFTKFYDIMSADYANRDSKVYRTIRKTFDQSSLLVEDGWTPNAPVVFYHDMEGNDEVIPFEVTEAAMKRFGFTATQSGNNCSYVDAIRDYAFDRNAGDNHLWHPAVFREIWESDLRYPGQLTIMTLAQFVTDVKYDYSDLSHRAFGARFHVQLLAGRMMLRPNSEEGVGNAAPVAIAGVSNSEVTAKGTSTEGSYDCITTAMPYTIPAGEGVFVQFPAVVDGYYFGCDASRYEVGLNDNGEAVSYTEMDDDADFEAGKVYYVVSENEETEPVLSMTAGLRTEAIASPLVWRELNIRPLNEFNGKSYATAYMPFAYEKSDVVYRAEDGGDEVLAYPAEQNIAIGTGTILVDDNCAKTALLVPTIAEPEGGSYDSCLLGKYEDHANAGYLTFGRNKAKTEIGFFKYSGGSVKAYSCYLEAGSLEAKTIVLASEETAINGLQTSDNVEIFTLDGVRSAQLRKGVNLVRKGESVVKLYIK